MQARTTQQLCGGKVPISFETESTLKIKDEAIKALEEQLSEVQYRYESYEKDSSRLNATKDKLICSLREKVRDQESQLALAKERIRLYSKANHDLLGGTLNKSHAAELQAQVVARDNDLIQSEMSELQTRCDKKLRILSQSLERETNEKETVSKKLTQVEEELAGASSKILWLELEAVSMKEVADEHKQAAQTFQNDAKYLNDSLNKCQSMGLDERTSFLLKEREDVIAHSNAQIKSLTKELSEWREADFVRQEYAYDDAVCRNAQDRAWDLLIRRVEFAECELAKLGKDNPMLKLVTDPSRTMKEVDPVLKEVDANREGVDVASDNFDDIPYHDHRREVDDDYDDDFDHRFDSPPGDGSTKPYVQAQDIVIPAPTLIDFSPEPEWYGPGDKKGKGRMTDSPAMPTPPKTPS